MNNVAPSEAVTSDELAEQHLPLVAHLVREVASRVPASVDRDDLRSAGLVALVAASRSFDPAHGVPFAAYATTRIRGALVDELRSMDWASRSVRRRSRAIEDTRSRLAAAAGAFPDDTAVARALGISSEEVNRSDADIRRATVISLHAGDDAVADVLPARTMGPEEATERVERLEYLSEAIAELPERLRVVVQGYFIDERPMAEIGEELGVSESRVSQMRAEALVLLREALASALEPRLVQPAANPTGVAARRKAAYAESVQARYAARLRPSVGRSA